MSIWLHPYVTALWLLTMVPRIGLVSALSIYSKDVKKLLWWLIGISLVVDIWALVASFTGDEIAYSVVAYLGQYSAHFLAGAIVVLTFLDLNRKPMIWKYGNPYPILGLIVLVSIALWKIHDGPVDFLTSLATSVDQAFQIMLCGSFWILALLTSKDILVNGFLGIYTVGMITSSIRASLPTDIKAHPEVMVWFQALWVAELSAQLLVTSYWFFKITKKEET